MLYLEYELDGFLKKFPLTREVIILGRLSDCDFQIEKDYISRKHLKIYVNKGFIELEDLNSKNGFSINGFKVKTATLKEGEGFEIANICFRLKSSNDIDIENFEKTKKFYKKNMDEDSEVTNYSLNIFDRIISYIIDLGIKGISVNEILKYANPILKKILKTGRLMILYNKNNNIEVKSEILINKYNQKICVDSISKSYKIFNKEIVFEKINNKTIFTSYPLINNKYSLIFITSSNNKNDKIAKFLIKLKNELKIIIEKQFENKEKDKSISIITSDENLINILNKAKRIAKKDLFILIEGETGTGKELLAKFIHMNSKNSQGNFIAINCSAIPDNLLESELFGFEKGAFTDANSQKKGKIELANNGTLILDEIGDLPLNLQAKLLRVLQEGEFYRLGGIKPIKVNFRLISLTNKNLKELIKDKQFREDLYFRIAHYKFKLPPLRERKNDIINLFNYFFKLYSNTVPNITNDAIELFKKYKWPGNVRELMSVAKTLSSILNENEIIDEQLLVNEFEQFPPSEKERNKNEKLKLIALLERFKWNKSRVAEELNISRTSLYKKLRKHKIN